MSKPLSLQQEYDQLLARVARCKHPVSPDNRHSYGAAEASLEACRQDMLAFRRRFPRLARDKAATIAALERALAGEERRLRRLRKAAGYKPPRLVTIFDLVGD